jgi:hypothetical protein
MFIPDDSQLARLRVLYEQGLYLAAYNFAKLTPHSPNGRGRKHCCSQGRLAGNLGASKLAAQMHTRAWRGAPSNGDARYFRARAVLDHKGPLAAWRFIRRYDDAIPAASLTPPTAVRNGWRCARRRSVICAISRAPMRGSAEPRTRAGKRLGAIRTSALA